MMSGLRYERFVGMAWAMKVVAIHLDDSGIQ